MADDVDGKIKIGAEIDTKGSIKSVKELSSTILKTLGPAAANVTAAVKTFKAMSKAIKETTEALNVQLKAEKQLEVAAKNNPYLDGSSVKQLKEFASQLQSISTVGDETLIPLMSQLASAGRTQAEIQKIMSAALDLSASGMMSLDSAVTQLNATYSGNIGLMGRQISSLKDLTAEELKSGKAIEIIQKQFKGIAEETTKAAGSFQQMKNAQGDFNEAVGKMTKPTSDTWNKFWKGWYERGIEAVGKLNEFIDTESTGKTLANTIAKRFKEIEKEGGDKYGYLRKSVEGLSEEQLHYLNLYLEGIKKRNKYEEEIFDRSTKEVERRKEYDKEQTRLNKQGEEARRKKKEQEEAQQKYNEAIERYNTSLQEALDKEQFTAEIKREEYTEQDKLNTMLEAYFSLIEEIGAEDPFSKEKLKELMDFANGIKWVVDEEEELTEITRELQSSAMDSAKSLIDSLSSKSMTDTIQETIEALKDEAKQFNENSTQYAFYVGKIEELSKLKNKILEQERQDNINSMMSNINNYVSEFADITSKISELALDKSEKLAEKESNNLAKSYTDGLISYEEYCEKKKELNKKQALEEYKIKLWEYNASLAQAIANVAQGVTEALTLTPPLNFIQAGLVSAAGAVQIAQLKSALPQKPTFQTGGIVGGSSYSGDHIEARVNSGEMILNAVQQANLWKMANSGNGSGAVVNMPVNIEDNNGSAVRTQLDANGLRVIIDDAVNTSLQLGKYSKSLNINNNRNTGVRYL